eukprot:88635_1
MSSKDEADAHEEFNIPKYINSIADFTESVQNRLNSLENRLDSMENRLNSVENKQQNQQSTHSQLLKRIESIEKQSSRNDTNTHTHVIQPTLIGTIEETQFDAHTNKPMSQNAKQETKEQENDIDDPLDSDLESSIHHQNNPTLNENMNHNNHNMPILEPATEMQEEKSQKENIGPNALQMFGLQSMETQIVEDDNEEDDANNIDLDVLFSSLESTTHLANEALNQCDYDTALEHLREGLDELDKYIPDIDHVPTDKKHVVAVAYHNQGICYGKLCKWAAALVSVNKCLSIQPDWFKGYSTLAALYAFQKRNDEAIKAYERAIELCPSNDVTAKNKLNSRYRSLINHKQNTNVNNNKRRLSGTPSWDESPAKRTKHNTNDRMNRVCDQLQNKTVSELGTMLEMNGQKKSGRKNELIERVCDGVINGAIPKCPKCNSKYLKYNRETGYYSCNGSFNAATKQKVLCDFYSNSVVRKPWVTIRSTRSH